MWIQWLFGRWSYSHGQHISAQLLLSLAVCSGWFLTLSSSPIPLPDTTMTTSNDNNSNNHQSYGTVCLPPSPHSVADLLPVQIEESLNLPRKAKQRRSHRHPLYNEKLRDFAGVAGNVLEWYGEAATAASVGLFVVRIWEIWPDLLDFHFVGTTSQYLDTFRTSWGRYSFHRINLEMQHWLNHLLCLVVHSWWDRLAVYWWDIWVIDSVENKHWKWASS